MKQGSGRASCAITQPRTRSTSSRVEPERDIDVAIERPIAPSANQPDGLRPKLANALQAHHPEDRASYAVAVMMAVMMVLWGLAGVSGRRCFDSISLGPDGIECGFLFVTE